MLLHNIGALIKIIIGLLILFYLYNYVNIYQDKNIAYIFGFVGIGLVAWGLSYFIFFIFQRIFSNKTPSKIAEDSYKLSLLFGLFIIINAGLIILEKWTKMLGIGIFLIFIILQIISVGNDD